MTIAVIVKVNNGVVVASDSATTINHGTPQENIYNHENKVFNLRKGMPIFGVTCGSGNIGLASISTLAKDLRQRFTDGAPGKPPTKWKLNKGSYSIQSVSALAREFLFDEKFKATYPTGLPGYNMSFFIGGYGGNAELPEVYDINILNDSCAAPREWAAQEGYGIYWAGQPEAIQRLLLGYGSGLGEVLKAIGVKDDEVQPVLQKVKDKCFFQLTNPAMPIQDAIDLAVYLVEVTIGFCRFNTGSKVVGGPIEVAAITKHEGFKWVRRKHYFNSELNP